MYSATEIERVEQLRRGGHGGRKIAALTGIGRSTVYRIILGLHATQRAAARPPSARKWKPTGRGICPKCNRETRLPCLACFLRGSPAPRRVVNDGDGRIEHQLRGEELRRFARLHGLRESPPPVDVPRTDTGGMSADVFCEPADEVTAEA